MKEKFEQIIEDIRRLNEIENKPTENKFIKFNEEFGEFCAEYIKQIGYTNKKPNIDHLKEEMADALQCLISIYLDIEKKYGINILNDILPEILNKNIKWEEKIKDYQILKNNDQFDNFKY